MRFEQIIEEHKNNNCIKSAKARAIAIPRIKNGQLRSCKPISIAPGNLSIRQLRINKENDGRTDQNRKNERRFLQIELLRSDAVKLVETNRGKIQPECKQMCQKKTEDEERMNQEARG